MRKHVKLPSGEDAQVIEAVTLRLSSGAEVTAEGVPVEVLARGASDWIKIGFEISQGHFR